jgi:hypothetical protein
VDTNDRDKDDAPDPAALRRQALDVIAALDAVEIDLDGASDAWRYRGGRDLAQLVVPKGSL